MRFWNALGLASVSDLNEVLALVEGLEKSNMALSEAVKAEFLKVDTATNALAGRVDAIVARLESAGNADAEVVAELQRVSAALGGIAADPENPVPPVVEPEPVPADDEDDEV